MRLWTLALLPLLTACSLQKMAIRQMTPMFPEGIAAFEEEPDYQLARESLAGQLKLLETLHRNDRSNLQLRILLAQGYASYALLFVEEDGQAIELEDSDAADAAVARARKIYARARDFLLPVLKERSGFQEALSAGVGDEGIAAFKNHLNAYGKKDVPLLFWTAYAWGSYINMSRDDIEAIANAPHADAMMQRVIELEPGYFNAAPHLYFALLNAAKPVALGGKPKEALRHFEEASKLTGGKFLLADVFWARFYAVQIQDQELYIAKLKSVLDAPENLYPRQALANALAKRKAARYLKNVQEYF